MSIKKLSDTIVNKSDDVIIKKIEDMKFLAIDTSCDETAAAVTQGRKILTNVLYSQVSLHKEWGGVKPDVALRAHQEHIDEIIGKALKQAGTKIEDIDALAVTFGPGLAIALGVGIDKALDLAQMHNKPLIPVNHMEGHIYSCLSQNKNGNPIRDISFPCMALLVSGCHTELVLMKSHATYEILGETLDDALGEALDKVARLIMGQHIYPGGALVEQLALTGDPHKYKFPIPMRGSKNLDFSYSGLKTSVMYVIKEMTEEERIREMHHLAASFQYAAFESVALKLQSALKKYPVSHILVGGGVAVNKVFKKRIMQIAKNASCKVYFPSSKKLYGDNAGMIGVAAHFNILKSTEILLHHGEVERNARARLGNY